MSFVIYPSGKTEICGKNTLLEPHLFRTYCTQNNKIKICFLHTHNIHYCRKFSLTLIAVNKLLGSRLIISEKWISFKHFCYIFSNTATTSVRFEMHIIKEYGSPFFSSKLELELSEMARNSNGQKKIKILLQ